MPSKLQELTIIVPESRELDLFVSLLEEEGAIASRCPLVRILDVDDPTDMDGWIRRLVERPFDDLVLFTGEGLRRLARRAEALALKERFVVGVARTRTIVRGPKPIRALRELGLAPSITAPAPTSQGLITALAADDLRARRVGVQLYPGSGSALVVRALEEKGAHVDAVTPYRYASATETSVVADIIRKMAAGQFGMIAFTSTPQVERLVEVARDTGLERTLAQGLKLTRVAAIGPVVEHALKKIGVADTILPAGNAFHLKPLVRAIVSAWSG